GGTGFSKRSCSNKRIERDDDSKKSHHALGNDTANAVGGRRAAACAAATRTATARCNDDSTAAVAQIVQCIVETGQVRPLRAGFDAFALRLSLRGQTASF